MDGYGDWAEQLANAEDVAFVDLEARIADAYDQLGPVKVELLFADPHTHTTAAGAMLNASTDVDGLRGLGNANPLSKCLIER